MANYIKIKILIFILLGAFFYSGCSVTPVPKSSTSQYLEYIRGYTPKLVSFLNNFPKGADLHNHAIGASYIEFGLEYALKNNYYYDVDKLIIVAPSNDIKQSNSKDCDASSDTHKCLITIHKFLSNPKIVAGYLDIVSMRGWHPYTANGQDHFFNTFSHMKIPKRAKSEYIALITARNYTQGVRYVELMTSSIPYELIENAKSLLDRDSFELNQIEQNYAKLSNFLESKEFEQSIIKFMDEREDRIDNILQNTHNITIKGDTPDIVVRYIPQLFRKESNFDVFIQAALNMKASSIDKRIVAINMVQNESALNSRINFDTQMIMLDYLWKQLGEPNIALHAGELVLRESPLEPMRNRISKSILVGHASRIGHGVSIPWESNPAQTLALMKKRGVAIEICLSSNDVILGVKGKDHPFLMYKDAGVPITISTDDEGVSRSNLTMEYVKAVQEFNLSYEDIQDIARNGLKYSFLEGDGIYNIDGTIIHEFQKYIDKDKPSVDKVGLKEYLQIMLERDFLLYSKQFSKL